MVRRLVSRILGVGLLVVGALAASSGAVSAGAGSPAAGVSARPGDLTAERANVPYLKPVPTPSWWKGTCDVGRSSSSHKVASWEGLIACAPGVTGHLETGPLAPNVEWQCVELAERWLYQEYGLPVQRTDGWHVVQAYGAYLAKEPGTPLVVVNLEPGNRLALGTWSVTAPATPGTSPLSWLRP